MYKSSFDFYSHQPYLEYNRHYMNYRPAASDPLSSIIWEAYQADDFDAAKDLAFPDICADIMTLYTDNKAYCYFMGGTDGIRSMKDIEFIDNVKAICGFKFRPGSIGNIFREEVCDAAGSMIDAADIFYGGANVVDELVETADFGKRLQVMQGYIFSRLSDGYETDPLANYVTNRIMASHGTAKISEIADETGYTDRYIRKVLKSKLGMSAKTFSQIVKMQCSYHIGKETSHESKVYTMADLAMDSGYYDQSHMNASYKKLTGMLPSDAFKLYAPPMPVINGKK